MDGEAALGTLGEGAEAVRAGTLGELSEVETEGAEETGFDGGTGFSEAREREAVGLDGAGVDEAGEESAGVEGAERPEVADVCGPAEEMEVVTCCGGLVEATFSSGLSDCFIGGA